MILEKGQSLKELSDDMQYYAMKFDVHGWYDKSNTRYIGVVKDCSVVNEGEETRNCSHPSRLSRYCYCKDWEKILESSVNELRRYRFN